MKGVLVLLAALVIIASAEAQPADPDRIALAIEALSRISRDQIRASPKLTAALNRVLEATAGTSQFVELVGRFGITNQGPALIGIAIKEANSSTGSDALRVVMDSGSAGLISEYLESTGMTNRLRLVQALGNVAENWTRAFIEPFVKDAGYELPLRRAAVRSLVKTKDGAAELLRMAAEEELPSDLRFTATSLLHQVRWIEIRNAAKELLPAPRSAGEHPLPPLSELLSRKGDAAAGAIVFSRPDVGCGNCHQVNGGGIDFGPKLSEIGGKLGKDALYESIIDPNAGISFGYEAWEVILKNGDEAFGLIVSETAEEVAVKTQNGIVTRYQKSDIGERRKMTTSIMPTGLQQAMSVSDLVDLVEYLASLKSPSSEN